MARGDDARQSGPTLAETLNFNEEDLQANRNGRLSDAQQRRLMSQSGCGIVGAAVVVLALAGVGFWILALGSWQIASIFFVLAAVIAVLNRTGRGQFRAEVQAGRVAIAAGEITLIADEIANPNGGVVEYVLEVNDEGFVIPRDAFVAFEDNTVYRIYYLPQSRIVLAAEFG